MQECIVQWTTDRYIEGRLINFVLDIHLMYTCGHHLIINIMLFTAHHTVSFGSCYNICILVYRPDAKTHHASGSSHNAASTCLVVMGSCNVSTFL